jgi:tetratricopeptide (TPR) repeat protein
MQDSAAVPPTSPAPPNVESLVRNARELVQQRQFEAALAAARALLIQVPENRDVLYLIAVSERYLGRLADALATLRALEVLHPDYGRLYQERGHCYRALGDTQAAIRAYGEAVNRNETLSASWQALGALWRSLGRDAHARMAAARVHALERLPSEVLAAANLLAEGDLAPAEQLIREFLRRNAEHVEGIRVLAQLAVKREALDDAEFLLESALVFAPEHRSARFEHATVLLQRHKEAAALEEVKTLLALEPDNRAFRTLYANACVGLGRYEEAVAIFRDLLADAPEPADLHLSIAHALKTMGRQVEAIQSYRAAAASRAAFGDAYWSLANLKTYRFTDPELRRMQAAEADAATSPTDRLHLCFALGKGFEDRGKYQQSFAHYERGNMLARRRSRYAPESLEGMLQAQMSLCTPEFFAAHSGSGSKRSDPIFIVGLPRSGSTLLEQILASHSKVDGTMELPDIPRLANELNGPAARDAGARYPAVLAELQPRRLLQLAERYLADTQVYRTGKPLFIDKMPNNFRHIGLIQLLLPNAKIIDARREPLACCFSNFKQLFASGQEFTYSLEHLGRYYRSYVAVMNHWDHALPGKVLRVQHEDVLNDFEGQVRRLLDFVGLDFEAGCLEFHKTQRSVRTASSEQVRRPIYTEGKEQWRHFEPWLEPLRRSLGEHGTR